MVVVKVKDKKVEMSAEQALELQRGGRIGHKRPANDFRGFALDIK
jgi:hypothetical protein